MPPTITRGLLALALLVLASGATSAQVANTSRAAKAAPVTPASQLDELVTRLEQRDGLDLHLTEELTELLLKTPGLLSRVPQVVRGASLDASDTLIFALEDIGSPLAQTQLVRIHTDGSQRQMDRVRAIMGLGTLAEPTTGTFQSLWSTALQRGDPRGVVLSNTALLSLGRLGNVLRAQGSTQYAEVRVGLLDTLYQAGDPAERAMALKAIGNLHDEALGSEAAHYLLDNSAPVRASAAQSIGMVEDVSQRALLVERLTVEPMGSVRAFIVEALRQLPPDAESIDTVIGMVRTERNHEARASMTSYLVHHLSEYEQARPVLIALVNTDPVNRVRILASSVLRQD